MRVVSKRHCAVSLGHEGDWQLVQLCQGTCLVKGCCDCCMLGEHLYCWWEGRSMQVSHVIIKPCEIVLKPALLERTCRAEASRRSVELWISFWGRHISLAGLSQQAGSSEPSPGSTLLQGITASHVTSESAKWDRCRLVVSPQHLWLQHRDWSLFKTILSCLNKSSHYVGLSHHIHSGLKTPKCLKSCEKSRCLSWQELLVLIPLALQEGNSTMFHRGKCVGIHVCVGFIGSGLMLSWSLARLGHLWHSYSCGCRWTWASLLLKACLLLKLTYCSEPPQTPSVLSVLWTRVFSSWSQKLTCHLAL